MPPALMILWKLGFHKRKPSFQTTRTMAMRIKLSTRSWAAVGIFVFLALYVLFQARFLILGPRVYIDNPHDAEVLASALVTVRGSVSNIAWITLNGKQIFTDEEGLWEEKLLVSAGTSIMTVRVRDRFGRESEKSVRVIYNP